MSRTKYMILRDGNPEAALDSASWWKNEGASTPESFLPMNDVDAVKLIVNRDEINANESWN